VIGGGNTAMTDALYLDSIGAKVTVIHRRDVLRAEKRLVDSVMERKIPILLNSIVTEIKGDKNVESVAVKDALTGKEGAIQTDAAFVAIGETPISGIASSVGVETDEAGFIIVDKEMRTSIPRVYAAGDVIGGVRQIVTATGTGATAALTIFNDLTSGKWAKRKE
jgi:thioredoxin reductase (NADPH)